MAISITVNVGAVDSALAALARGMKDRTVANRQLAAQLYAWTINDYDGRGALQPQPWAPLRPRTIAEKIRLGYSPEPLAPRTGNLRKSFAPFSDSDQAGVGARASYGVDYAQVHEEGRPERNIPRRPMLPPREVAEGYASRVYGLFVTKIRGDAGL